MEEKTTSLTIRATKVNERALKPSYHVSPHTKYNGKGFVTSPVKVNPNER